LQLVPASNLASRQRRLSLAVGNSVHFSALTLALLHADELLADLLDAGAARSGDGGSVLVVGVDADQVGNALGLDVLNDDVARAAVVSAVTASSVQLSCVDDGKVLDGDGSAAIVLDNLVLGFLGAASLNQDISISQGRDCVYRRIR
jgi:hypothetical protein